MYKVKRFSKKSDEKDKVLNKEVKQGLALAGAGIGVNKMGSKILMETEGGPFKLKDGERLNKAIKDHIKEEGLKFREANEIEKAMLNNQKNAFYNARTKEVIDAGLGKKADIIAHELGHHKVQTSKNRLVKSTQGKLRIVSEVGKTRIGAIGSGLAGAYAGKKAAEAEARGEKEGFGSKYGHLIAAGSSSLPRLASEALASGHGLKELKKAGASKKDLIKAAGNLGLAGATYLRTPGINMGIAQVSKGIAKRGRAKELRKGQNDDE